MSDGVLDDSVPHLRLVVQRLEMRTISGGRGAEPLSINHMVMLGWRGENDRAMVSFGRRKGVEGQPPPTNNQALGLVYLAERQLLDSWRDLGALTDQADPRYAFLLTGTEDPNPAGSV
ncbi:MAG TPA: hypothetical protein VNL35_16670 [Chloroflexota bacterium]|nr:hypothetical protein [Chloroflexota bacterium]